MPIHNCTDMIATWYLNTGTAQTYLTAYIFHKVCYPYDYRVM